MTATVRFLLLACSALTAAQTAPLELRAQAAAKQTAKPAATPAAMHIDVARDKVGAEPSTFLPMVGNWVVAEEGGKKVVRVDGRVWKRGQPAGGLADKARAIYGAKHEEFIDNVTAFAYFPIAVAKGIDQFSDGDITVKFMMIGGSLDRCGGILFNVQPNGDYLAFRFNGTEDNAVLWTFNNGKRTFVKRGTDNVPLELGTWHELRVSVHGTAFKGYLDDKLMVDFTLKAPVSGKVGLWSKTDSMTEFSEFTVTPAAVASGAK
jgi:hypothetical protein